MLDPSYIRDHTEEVRTGLRNRGIDPDKVLEEIVTLETARRRMIPELEGLKRAQNTSGDEHRVAQTERLALSDVREVDHVRDLADLLELLFLAARFEKAFELDRDVEVILDRVLAAAGDQEDVVDARRDRFLDAVLDDRLVHQRQHFLGLRFGGREETRAESGGGEDSFSDGRHNQNRNVQ